jgi:hypothetical protein
MLMLPLGLAVGQSAAGDGDQRHLLYVATPGVRNYREYGGHGLLVFDIAACQFLGNRAETTSRFLLGTRACRFV